MKAQVWCLPMAYSCTFFQVFIAGDDFKSGQTKLKSVLVDFLVGAGLKPTCIVSYNHLGNNDGMNLSAPQTFRSKEVSEPTQGKRCTSFADAVLIKWPRVQLLDTTEWRTVFRFYHAAICAGLSVPVTPLYAQLTPRLLQMLKVPCPSFVGRRPDCW